MAATITVACPFCSNRMRASAEYVGRKGRCPACKALIEIRPADEQSLETILPTVAGFPRDVDPRLSSTSVSGWKSAVAGIVAAVVLYVSIWAVWKTTGWGALIADRGPMPLFILLVSCWGLAVLALKYVAVRRQIGCAERELELIPLEVGVQITPGNVDQFLAHLAGRPQMQRLSIVGRRIHGALEHFKSRQSVPEVQEYLATQAELDASAVDSGYTMLRAIIWAVPILGFIGTVMGISSAVSGLGVGGEDGGQELMEGLRLVTAGLATAFDTTLIALVMAILLLFPTESLRKAEYAMLDRIEAFANESLLRRMTEERQPPAAAELPDVVRHALDAAFKEHQRWLAQWQAQVSRLGQSVGADLETSVARMLQQIDQAEGPRIEKLDRLIVLAEELSSKAAAQTSDWHDSSRQLASSSREFVDAAGRLERVLAEQIGRLARRLDKAAGAAGLPAPTPQNVIEPLVEPANPAARSPRRPDGRGFWRRLFGRD